MKWKATVCGALLSLVGFTATANAASITGELNITGTVEVSLNQIDWIPEGPPDGVVLTVDPGTLYFADIFNPDQTQPYVADSLDLSNLTVFPLANFLNDFSAPGYDGLSFTLTEIPLPTAPPCVGGEANDVSCSFGLFTLTQRDGAVDVSLGVLGFFIDLNFSDDGTGNTAAGTYTTQLIAADRDTIGEVMAIILGGGSIRQSFSATYVAEAVVVPEPATLALLGIGLIGAGYRARRRRLVG